MAGRILDYYGNPIVEDMFGKTPQGKVRSEFKKYYNKQYGVWTFFSPEFIDPLTVSKSYRISVLGYYWEHPTEALREFCQDDNPSVKKTMLAIQALVWRWDEIEPSEKITFLKRYDQVYGLSAILGVDTNNYTTMSKLLAFVGAMGVLDVDAYTAVAIFAMCQGMENLGDYEFTQAVKGYVKQSPGFKGALNTMNLYNHDSFLLDKMKQDIENKYNGKNFSKTPL